MPCYDYKCESCGHVMERYYKMELKPRQDICDRCRGTANAQIPLVAVHGEEAIWIDDELRGALQSPEDAARKPVTTRSEYNKYLKDNDIIPVS